MERALRWAVVALATSLAGSIGQAQVTERVSVATDGTEGNAYSALPSISADGRYMAFASDADNLVPGDTNGSTDIFVRDRVAGTIEPVSLGMDGTPGNSHSWPPSISADGRYVAFASWADNLVPGDTNAARDLFVRDRIPGTTERVSVATDGSQANGRSEELSISADGRYVAFASGASNLIPGDTNLRWDVFVRDRISGTTERVSLATDGTQGNSDSYYASISADGRYVAFSSEASNLIPGDTNLRWDVFVRDRVSDTTERVSVATDGSQGNGQSFYPSLSSDGRYVAFESAANNLVPGDTNGTWDVFVRDRVSGTTERVSVATNGAQGNSSSYYPSISADGRYLAFHSTASNLVPGDTNGAPDIFLRDRLSAATERVSVATDGTQGNNWTGDYVGSISAGGRYVAFDSSATNLVLGDTNGATDVFVRDRGPCAGNSLLPCRHGRVVLGTGQLHMRNVTVDAVHPDTGIPMVTATTDSEGTYFLQGIPDGPWVIRASLEYPGPNGQTTIANYPEDDPDKTWTFVGGNPVEPCTQIRFPDPVILQAGWSAPGGGSTPPDSWPAAIAYLTADAWDHADKRANRLPAFVCYENDEYDATARTLNHDTNGLQLAGFINAIDDLDEWIDPAVRPTVPFSILAHSMGGLITRAMVKRGEPGQAGQPVAARIVTLDTPHGGSSWAMLGGYRALMESFLNGRRPFSCQPISRPGWNEDHIELPSSGRSWLLYSCVDDITVLPIVSAWGWGRPYVSWPVPGAEPNSDCYLRWVNQGWLVAVPDRHWGDTDTVIHHNPNRLREYALYLARGTLPSQNPPASPGAPGDPTDGLGFLVNAQSAPTGGSSTAIVSFDANALVYGRILLAGVNAQYTLTDEFGMPLALTNLSTEAVGDDASLDSFEIVAPPVGIVQVELTAGSSAAELSYAFYFDNLNRLVVTATPDALPEGGTTNLVAWLEDGGGNVLAGNNGALTATVQRPDASVESIDLFDDGAHGDGAAGDGVFGGTFGGATTTDLQGRYLVDVHGFQDFGGYVVERSGSGGFAVMPTGATFSGSLQESGVDDDGDGLFDSLEFEVGISLTSDGSYKVIAELTEPNATIGGLAATFENTGGPGSTTVRLSIAGAELVRHAVPGPWTLSNLRLIRLDADSLPTDEAPDHVTQAYPLSAFNSPPPPSVAALVPSSGSRFGGYEVVLEGSHLLDATSVLIGANLADFVVQDDHSLLLTIPPMDRDLSSAWMKPSVPVDVLVTTPWGSDLAAGAFRYRP